MSPIRRNEDTGTIEVSAKAFNFGISILTAFILAVGGVGYGVVTGIVRMDERIKHLEQFADEGRRNTADHGKERDRRIAVLENWRTSHTQWGREKAGKWDAQFSDCERRLQRLER